ncbi:MAG: hypothetical protein WAL85_14865 [Candidatus Korobacteraceae bacterium]
MPPIVSLLPQLAAFLLLHLAQAQQTVPVHHWPWWLRLVALLGVLVFIRVAVTFARGSGRPR